MSSLNPFAALIEDTGETKPIPTTTTTTKSITTILEEIFGFTLNETSSRTRSLLYLADIAQNFNRTDLDLLIIQHVLFDRLFMCNEDNLAQYNSNDHAYESKVITYLWRCYGNVRDCGHLTSDERTKLRELIVQNSVTAFIQSDIYDGQQLDVQLIDILKEQSLYYEEFFMDLCRGLVVDEDGGELVFKEKLSNLINILTTEIKKSYLTNFNYDYFNVLKVFASNENLAILFLDVKPAKFVVGADYVNTPLGALFNISILPKSMSATNEHFQNPFDQISNVGTEGILWTNTDKMTQHIHSLILTLLTCSATVKNKTLQWLGDCLASNADRRKLWNAQAPPELNTANYTNVGDGFMINVSNVMLRLCRPFCTNFNDKKILKVDPTYCAVPTDKIAEKGIHLPDLASETCLVPVNSDDDEREEILLADSYNFITECFYFAQKALNLGYQVTVDKFFRLNNEVGRMERAYNDALQQVGGGNPDFVDTMKQRMRQELTRYLSMKAQLSDPVLLNFLFDFTASTTYWLCQVALHSNFKGTESYAPLNEITLKFPLTNNIPSTLKCIPEFIVENVVCLLRFVRRFSPKIFEEKGHEKLSSILSFVLVYMGEPARMKNPHCRATLAEALESLLPHHEEESIRLNAFGGFQREMLFNVYEYRDEIVTSLLNVFVGIEMTGQSVEFEQKFNYRRPMYAVMNYLWNLDEYQQHFKSLAEDAENNMDAVSPPLFLKFVNLLMNDAVYLLDEALANMAKLKDMERAKENGEWDSLPVQERTQNISYMHHIGMMAKFDNVLGRDTINTIVKLTSKITTVFTHATMVDRVAAMLNYFLYNLVGPNKKNFKVKDQKEYSFDPAATVLNICKIYVNLKDSDSFCLAISQDGRSYSPQLFILAEDVLIRIGGGLLIEELKEVATRVAAKAEEDYANEEAVAEAPEHFLDPIMSTLMRDPVTLPSSKQIVDRTTIARHLLSDQTDPFNRAPLSMDQVVPNVELAEEIRCWIQERKSRSVA